MTYVLAHYENENGLKADIEQDKYCSSFRLDVYRSIDDNPLAMTVYRGNYYTKKTARQALNRFGSDWKKVEI